MAKVQPIKDAAGWQALEDQAHKAGGWVALFHDIAVATGWRTGDICGLRFDEIDFDEGRASITVDKQTKAARTRAFLRGVKTAISARLLDASDQEFRRLTLVKPADFVPELTPGERAACEEMASKAKAKTDSKLLPPDVIDRIRALREQDTGNEWVFARQFTDGRNSKGMDGHVTRQAAWKAFKKLGAALKEAGVRVKKFSVYSTRKIAAYMIMTMANAAGKDGKAAARDFLGHKDITTTEHYLCLDQEEADATQREFMEFRRRFAA